VGGAQKFEALQALAEAQEAESRRLNEANREDLVRAEENGLSEAMVDRLRLDETRIGKMAESVRQIAEQTDPVGQVIEGQVRPNGLRIEKVRVPLGAILFIYESRPNVTSDAAALCLKSGNGLILRGGKEALASNTAIADLIRSTFEAHRLDPNVVQLVRTTDREAVGHLLKMEGLIDLVIPRGGESLIRAVVEQSRIPVIKHYTGNCHVYVDAGADQLGAMAEEICFNAKVQRPGVCNAAETLLFHRESAAVLKALAPRLLEAGVTIRGCEATSQMLSGLKIQPATEEDWDREYLDLVVAVRVVGSLTEAVDHINRHGSGHTDAIVTPRIDRAERFVATVDSGNVMVNCSTRFSDGGEYGLGAEIGISTDKLHARGPMGAADMTTYKWIVRGDGQIRT
ncbi:MAG: glutamate-5-semialdehyde dehydrogenase, partial [Phycisphaeraceae bacterium]|nr:glutamate-5-semialdehyde dehydrogenase [Phycisphaeraceae bacterium]